MLAPGCWNRYGYLQPLAKECYSYFSKWFCQVSMWSTSWRIALHGVFKKMNHITNKCLFAGLSSTLTWPGLSFQLRTRMMMDHAMEFDGFCYRDCFWHPQKKKHFKPKPGENLSSSLGFHLKSIERWHRSGSGGPSNILNLIHISMYEIVCISCIAGDLDWWLWRLYITGIDPRSKI